MSEAACKTQEAVGRANRERTSPLTIWAVSLAFWIVLLIAAALYASVALAPRLSDWIDIRHRYITNAHHVKALETEVDYLERVRGTLQTDPEFARQLATTLVPEEAGDGELIPVNGSLIFGSEDDLHRRMPDRSLPLGTDTVQILASHHQLRTGLLATAGLLVVFAFTVLNGSGGWFVSTFARLLVATVHVPLARYRRSGNNPDDHSPVKSVSA